MYIILYERNSHHVKVKKIYINPFTFSESHKENGRILRSNVTLLLSRKWCFGEQARASYLSVLLEQVEKNVWLCRLIQLILSMNANLFGKKSHNAKDVLHFSAQKNKELCF